MQSILPRHQATLISTIFWHSKLLFRAPAAQLCVRVAGAALSSRLRRGYHAAVVADDVQNRLLLDYADAAQRFGIVHEVREDLCRIVVPPARWNSKTIAAVVVMLLITTLTIVPLAVDFVFKPIRRGTPIDWANVLPQLLGQMIVPAIVITAAVWMYRRAAQQATTFEVTADRFRFSAFVQSWERGQPMFKSMDVERSKVTRVKGHLFGMGLTIRVEGVELFELMHDHPQPVRECVAELLREALGIVDDSQTQK